MNVAGMRRDVDLEALAGITPSTTPAIPAFNNSVPLVAGKATLVRAYARTLENTTGRASFPVDARMRGFRNGVQVGPSPASSSRS